MSPMVIFVATFGTAALLVTGLVMASSTQDQAEESDREADSDPRLIDCPDCGKEISSSAQACPNCGRPIKADEAESDLQEEGNRLGFWTGLLLLFVTSGLSLAGTFGGSFWVGSVGNFVALMFVVGVSVFSDYGFSFFKGAVKGGVVGFLLMMGFWMLVFSSL